MTTRTYWLQQLRTLGIVLLAVYAVLVVAVRSPLYEAIVLRPFAPDKNYERARQLPGYREYVISGKDGASLHAWFFDPGRARTLVIVHHGNAGNVSHRLYLADAIVACGAAALVYDYRGYGKSSGTPGVPGLLDDGLAVYDFARSKLGFAGDHIVNFGESIGTGVACQVASMRPSAALVLQSPVGSLPGVAHAGIVWLNIIPDCFFPTPQFDNVQQIKQVHVPLLMFHGTSDRVVPFEHSKMIYANAHQPKNLILFKDAGHNNMPADSRQYRDALCQFLKSVERN